MPSDQEKLAIAEEIIPVLCNGTMRIHLIDIDICRLGPQDTWIASIERHGVCKSLAENFNLIAVIGEARQKLAAEKEAARTPEERRLAAENERLTRALKTILDRVYLPCEVAHEIARKALEGAAQ